MKSLLLVTLILFTLSSCKEAAQEASTSTDSNESCEYENISSTKRSPQTIDELTDLINEMPKPLSIPCLVESFARPLKVNLTLSSLSAQPAVGRTSPRVFIFYGDLVISIVPEGKGAYLLEASFMYTDSTSLKAEYEFPISQKIEYAYPFDRIKTDSAVNGEGTVCRTCHNDESLDNAASVPGAFTSVAIKPESSMSISTFKSELNSCEFHDDKSYRCQMIQAIFKGEDLVATEFPSGTPKWIDTL